MSIGVGGSFDMIAGNQKIAPKIVSDIGMEWLWRLMQDPRKRVSKVIRSMNTLFKIVFGKCKSN